MYYDYYYQTLLLSLLKGIENDITVIAPGMPRLAQVLACFLPPIRMLASQAIRCCQIAVRLGTSSYPTSRSRPDAAIDIYTSVPAM